MNNTISRTDVAILIPTCTDRLEDLRIGYVLSSIAQQDCGPMRVYVRDEGKIGMFSDRNVRQLWDLLALRNFECHYQRTLIRKGVGVARFELVHTAPPGCSLMFIDDDMLLLPNTISQLLGALEKQPEGGFFQGAKIQIDSSIGYWNDINRLNAESSVSDLVRLTFGDAALLLIKNHALNVIDWELVTRYSMEGLPGEDVAMTLMIANKFECWGVPSAKAYHLAPSKNRWQWEAASDVLQAELLRDRISRETLLGALPHLKAVLQT